MSYETVEDSTLILIRDKVPGYSATNISSGDYRILASGVEKAIILNPGSIRGRQVVAAQRYISTTWVVEIELFIPWHDDLSSIANKVRQFRQEVIDLIDQYPRINSSPGVLLSLINGASRPTIRAGEGRNWWIQILDFEVTERVDIVVAE